MCLRLKARVERDFNQAQFIPLDEVLGVLNPPGQDIFMGSQAGRSPELSGKVHAGQASRSGKILKTKRCCQIVLDKRLDFAQAP
jgi:hypothetical protein